MAICQLNPSIHIPTFPPFVSICVAERHNGFYTDFLVPFNLQPAADWLCVKIWGKYNAYRYMIFLQKVIAGIWFHIKLLQRLILKQIQIWLVSHDSSK